MTLSADSYGLLAIQEVPEGLLASFDCDKTHLNDFLITKAKVFQAKGLGITSLVMHPDFDGVAGYFTLSNDSVQLKTSEWSDLDLDEHSSLSHIPSVKIGRLAVARTLHGQGVSDEVMRLAIGEIFLSSAHSAARLAVVDADNDPRVIRYYERNGFVTSLWAEDQYRNNSKKLNPRQNVKMLRDLLVLP